MGLIDLKVGEEESGSDEASKKSQAFVQNWMAEISKAQEREKTFRKKGLKCVKLYEGDDAVENSFNILFSNTETLAPALYNSLPRPVVQRRFKDEDPLGLAAATLGKRVLEYLSDSDQRDYPPLDELLQASVLEGLVPGRGQVRFRYDATFTQVVEQREQVAGTEGTEAAESDAYEKVEGEYVCGEDVPWDRFLHGYAKKWKDVPWVAYMHFFSKEELTKNFGDVGAKVKMTAEAREGEDDENPGRDETSKGEKLALVYEIWDKTTKEVIFLSPGFMDDTLKRVPDPLGLSGFFPSPRPLMFMRRISSLLPTPLYVFYEEQAKELNRVTTRINKLIAALKVRGFYDSTVEGIEKVLQAEDNILIPAENVAALQQGQSLEKALFLMPIDKLIAVLQQLYTQRQQTKQVIYEITGIADIMRGSSAASETLGAQQIKNQWGTLRMKKAQKEVARFARDCFRIMLEIAVTKLSPDTIKRMTGVQLPLAAEKQQAQAIAQQLQMQAPPLMPGQPPQAPQLPLEVEQILTLPTLEDVLAILQDDLQRSYRVDIETNSTVDLEATEDKQDMSELMNSIAQFLNGVAPAVEQGVLPFEAAKAMLLGIVRRFRFGDDVEEQLKKMTAPQPPQEKPDPKTSPEVMAAQAQAEATKANLELRKMQMEMEHSQAEHAMKMEELKFKREQMILNHQLAMDKMTMQAQMPQPQPKPAGNTPA